MRIKKIKFIKRYGFDIWGFLKYKGFFNRFRKDFGVSKLYDLKKKIWLKKYVYKKFLIIKRKKYKIY